MKKILALLLALAMILALAGCPALPNESLGSTVPSAPSSPASSSTATTPTDPTEPSQTPTDPTEPTDPSVPLLDEEGHYNSKEDVALYIHQYGRLPRNYVTKSQANALGCSSLGSIGNYWENGAIGGDVFQNREGLLPNKAGRTYYECDIDTWGKRSRGAKRIVFSNDGLVYYTGDHYASFELLYGEP